MYNSTCVIKTLDVLLQINSANKACVMFIQVFSDWCSLSDWIMMMIIKTLRPLFKDVVELSQDFIAIYWETIYFKPLGPQEFLVFLEKLPQDERLSQIRSHPVIFSNKSLDWESSALTVRIYFHLFAFIAPLITDPIGQITNVKLPM